MNLVWLSLRWPPRMLDSFVLDRTAAVSSRAAAAATPACRLRASTSLLERFFVGRSVGRLQAVRQAVARTALVAAPWLACCGCFIAALVVSATELVAVLRY